MYKNCDFASKYYAFQETNIKGFVHIPVFSCTANEQKITHIKYEHALHSMTQNQ